jgi:hypothetical protein
MYSLASLIVELQSARRRLLKTFLNAMPTTEPPTYDAASVLARKNHALGGSTSSLRARKQSYYPLAIT